MARIWRGFTPEQRLLLWRMWKAGSSITDIGIALNKPPGTIHAHLSLKGGICPAQRQRSARHLTLAQREEISRGLAAGKSLRSIAVDLQVASSTVSREIARNGGTLAYRALKAELKAEHNGRRPKACKLALNDSLRSLVASKLEEDWSPQQISGWLRKNHHGDLQMQLSHESIYRTLFIQARSLLKRELLSHLRSRRTMRRSKNFTTKGRPRGQIIDAVSIHQRPAAIEDRAVPGHWEGDLITGSSNSHIATLVERQSRFVMLVQVAGKDTASVVDGLTRQVQQLPDEMRKSLTWDRGTELAQHKRFTMATDVQVYFCDPKSPWQRGSNENTNGLLRQYFPKGMNLAGYSQCQLDEVAAKLNARPRKTLGYETPADVFLKGVALTD